MYCGAKTNGGCIEGCRIGVRPARTYCSVRAGMTLEIYINLSLLWKQESLQNVVDAVLSSVGA